MAAPDPNSHLEQLMIQLVQSLEREMRAGFAEVNARLDNQSNRLDRQGALLQTGSRWVNRMNAWAERMDKSIERHDIQNAEFEKRFRKVEGQNGNPGSH